MKKEKKQMKKLTSIFLALIILITSISFSDASCKAS